MSENLSNEEKIFYAIAQLLTSGETRITRYKVASMVSCSHMTVYRILNKYKETKCLQLQNQ